MAILYHGSKEHNIERLEPKKSTHGTYVYATPEKVLALIFSGRCGDDLTFSLGRLDTDENGPWELVENIPKAFDKMFSNSSSIYSLSDETFKDIHTRFEEVVSEVGVDVIDEEYFENVYDVLLQAQEAGLLKIYRYPNKPAYLKQDGSDILDKWRSYEKNSNEENSNKKFRKYDFDRLVYLYPNLMVKINELANELGYDYNYEPNDLIQIFYTMIETQLSNQDNEQYIESAYISICEAFPFLKVTLEPLYNEYCYSIEQKTKNK